MLLFLFSIVCSLNAALYDRGSCLIYDDVLNITWLNDANYAMTSGYDADGLMDWSDATAWAEQLEYGGFTDWRLPHALPTNGKSYDVSGFSPPGSKDKGYSVSAPGSLYAGSTQAEMAHLYHNSLGNLSRVAPDGSYPQPGYGLQNTGPFINLQPYDYWTSSDYSGLMTNGFQHFDEPEVIFKSYRNWFFNFRLFFRSA